MADLQALAGVFQQTLSPDKVRSRRMAGAAGGVRRGAGRNDAVALFEPRRRFLSSLSGAGTRAFA